MMQSEIVSRTNGCSCTAGLVSDARDVDMSGLLSLSAIFAVRVRVCRNDAISRKCGTEVR